MSWFPGFYFFIRLQLGMTAGFVPEVGFVPLAPRQLGKASQENEAYLALARAVSTSALPPPPVADAAETRRRIQDLLDHFFSAELDALDRLIAHPTTWMERKLDRLLMHPSVYAQRAPELVAAFTTARDAHHRPATLLLARLIAALPDTEFQANGSAIMKGINSRALAGRLVFDEAVAAQVPPPFDGFRLLMHVPRLYTRLGELGEPARPLVLALRKLFPKSEPLQEAEAILNRARPASEASGIILPFWKPAALLTF